MKHMKKTIKNWTYQRNKKKPTKNPIFFLVCYSIPSKPKGWFDQNFSIPQYNKSLNKINDIKYAKNIHFA